MTQAQKKRTKIAENTPLMVRVSSWSNRRPDTTWTVYEAEALAELGDIPTDDLAILETYYKAEIPTDDDYRRRTIDTLLNNWHQEVDRARRWVDSAPKREQEAFLKSFRQ